MRRELSIPPFERLPGDDTGLDAHQLDRLSGLILLRVDTSHTGHYVTLNERRVSRKWRPAPSSPTTGCPPPSRAPQGSAWRRRRPPSATISTAAPGGSPPSSPRSRA